MAVRYTDLDFGSSGAKDFVIRRRTPTQFHLMLIFASVLLLAVSITLTISDKASLLSILFIMLGTLAWYCMIQIQRSRDLVLATEFQNSLFASALGIHNKFCIIIKRDGGIVYLDRAFQEIFPDFLKQPRRSIDILLEMGRVSKDDSAKIFSAIERGVYEKVIFDIRGTRGAFHRMVMSIEPIMRPSGFILLRGREFVEARDDLATTGKTNSSLLNKSSITLFSHIMDSMNMGVYMTGPNGNMVYINPVLEQWLGFKEGEAITNNLALQHIVMHGGPEKIEPGNYEGEVILQKKTGGTLKAFINQKVIRDEQGKVVGCTALVHNYGDQTVSDVKKKLW